MALTGYQEEVLTGLMLGEGSASRHYKIMASTRPAKRLLREVDPVFPPQKKAQRWRKEIDITKRQPDCLSCGKDAVFRNGFYCGRGTTRLAQKFKCRACGYAWKEPLAAKEAP